MTSAIKVVRLSAVVQQTGLSRSTIYARIKAGLFPAPISLGARSIGWLAGEVDEWVQARVEASRRSK